MKYLNTLLDWLMRYNSLYVRFGIPVRLWIYRRVPCLHCGLTSQFHTARGWCPLASTTEYEPNFAKSNIGRETSNG